MSFLKPKVDLSKLPQDAMSYQDDKFYCLVKSVSSPVVADILKCQAINSIYVFLHTRDVVGALQLPTKTLDAVREKACYLLDDSTYVVLPGINSSIEYLTELFRRKNFEQTKPVIKKKFVSSDSSSAAMITTTISSPPTTITSAALSATSTLSTASQPFAQMIPTDHHSMITKSISKWTSNKEKEFGLTESKFEEGKEYTLTVSSSAASATILCRCGTKLSMPKPNGQSHFNLSNYYRHVQSMKCYVLRNKRSHSNSTNPNENDEANEGDTSTEDLMPTPPAAQSNKRSSSSPSEVKVTKTVKRRRL